MSRSKPRRKPIRRNPAARTAGSSLNAYEVSVAGNQLAWQFAAASNDPDELRRIIEGWQARTEPDAMEAVMYGALLVMTTLALEPAVQLAAKIGVDLRSEFLVARDHPILDHDGDETQTQEQ